MYNIDKQSLLLRSDRILFHTQDLALLWSIENRNTLYTTIKRYVEKGVLIPVVKGLYSVKPIDQIDTYVLGSVLIHKYCYVSCETVLADTGVINQDIIPITFVSSISLKVKVGSVEYLYSRLNRKYFLILTESKRKMAILWPQRIGRYAICFILTRNIIWTTMQNNLIHKFQLLRLLTEIVDNPILSQNIYFKGGTAAAMQGFLDRFSIDLDFDLREGSNRSLLRSEFSQIFKKLDLTSKIIMTKLCFLY